MQIAKLKKELERLKEDYEAISCYNSGPGGERVADSKISDSTAEKACTMADMANQIKLLETAINALVDDIQTKTDKLPDRLKKTARLRYIDCLTVVRVSEATGDSLRTTKYKLAEITKYMG